MSAALWTGLIVAGWVVCVCFAVATVTVFAFGGSLADVAACLALTGIVCGVSAAGWLGALWSL